MAVPVHGYISDPARTKGEVKDALEDIGDAIRNNVEHGMQVFDYVGQYEFVVPNVTGLYVSMIGGGGGGGGGAGHNGNLPNSGLPGGVGTGGEASVVRRGLQGAILMSVDGGAGGRPGSNTGASVGYNHQTSSIPAFGAAAGRGGTSPVSTFHSRFGTTPCGGAGAGGNGGNGNTGQIGAGGGSSGCLGNVYHGYIEVTPGETLLVVVGAGGAGGAGGSGSYDAGAAGTEGTYGAVILSW